jgi:hypothetical protein
MPKAATRTPLPVVTRSERRRKPKAHSPSVLSVSLPNCVTVDAAESPPPVAVKVGDGLSANPDSGAKGVSAEGVAELTLDSVCPGDSVNYPAAGRFPFPPTARCGLDANPSLGPWLLSEVQFAPGSRYRPRRPRLAWLSDAKRKGGLAEPDPPSVSATARRDSA